MTIVALHPRTRDWILDQARVRQELKERHGIGTRKRGDSADLTMHEQGLSAELAVARVLGLPFGVIHTLSGDRYDLELPSGLTVEVKSRGQRGYDFGVIGRRDFAATLGVLVWPVVEGDHGIREIVGWVARDEFAAGSKEVSNHRGTSYYYDWRRLHPLSTLDLSDDPAPY